MESARVPESAATGRPVAASASWAIVGSLTALAFASSLYMLVAPAIVFLAAGASWLTRDSKPVALFQFAAGVTLIAIFADPGAAEDYRVAFLVAGPMLCLGAVAMNRWSQNPVAAKVNGAQLAAGVLLMAIPFYPVFVAGSILALSAAAAHAFATNRPRPVLRVTISFLLLILLATVLMILYG